MEHVIFQNYDLYEVSPSEISPGKSFFNHLNEFKSIKDFLEKTRKKKKTKTAIYFRKKLLKYALDFPADNIKSDPIIENSNYESNVIHNSNPIGIIDHYLSLNDIDGKKPEELNFGNDLVDSTNMNNKEIDNDEMLSSKEPDLYGLPSGDLSPEELESYQKGPSNYGVTDSGNTIYNTMWI